jgi:hypothetical protein
MSKLSYATILIILVALLIVGGNLSSDVASATFPNVLAQPGLPTLGTAEDFAVLADSTATNTGSTVINGDLGVWPGTEVTGFPPGVITGTIHAGDAAAQQAQSDATIAYLDLAGRPCDVDLSGTDLGGLTLVPGVYCFSGSAQLTGQLTLDAQNNADAFFIFQIGSTLTTASNSSVLMINSGSACNAFWQVGSSATLGITTEFAGNVLALTSVTLNTGADVAGRTLAQNGSVTMDTNDISIAICDSGPTDVSLTSFDGNNQVSMIVLPIMVIMAIALLGFWLRQTLTYKNE